MSIFQTVLIAALSCFYSAQAACVSNSTDTAGLQSLLENGGANFTLSLCPSQTYELTQSLNFTKPNQEISTEGYPTDATRAILFVNGSTDKVTGHTTAIRGDCAECSAVRILNIQINGNRGNDKIYAGGGNIEIGGANQDQIVSFVKSWDPRGWSCLHVAEGPFQCSNVTISHNDIGPCGSDYFQYWADGVSLSCANSLVEENDITDATDGGIVIFGSPGSTIRNNRISVTDRVMLGGINIVDYSPWNGNFSNLLVEGNQIYGGFADTYGNDTVGVKNTTAMIKIGTAVGPLVWWGDERYGTNASAGPATVANNVYSGAMVFAIAMAGVINFDFDNNTLWGNTTFAGAYAVNCTTGAETPHPPTPFLMDTAFNTTNVTISNLSEFENGTAGGLTCFSVMEMPPLDEYPYGPGFGWSAVQVNASSMSSAISSSTSASPSSSQTSQPSASATQLTAGSERVRMGEGSFMSIAVVLGLLGIIPSLI